MGEYGHWQYPGDINVNDWFGFVYRIVELDTGREYIGKKQFHSHTRKKVAGRKNRKRVIKESDWKTYTGSSKSLNERMNEIGKDKYSFFIESLHETRGSLFYAEVEKQIKENVLREKLDDGTPKYYNRLIAGVKFTPPESTEIEDCANIENYILIEPFKSNHDVFLGEDNPMYGKQDVKNGLTYEQYYGPVRAEEIKKKLAECNEGKISQHRGINIHSEEQIKKWKNDDRRKFTGPKNGMYGKPCHYKMTEDEKERWKGNISAATKGKPKEQVTCPHCGKQGGKPPMMRFHFDNCKQKNH